jgi:FtsZ-interacting cell division protein ZipA
MSTGLIIAIVVVVLVLIAVAFIASRAGERGRMRRLEQERKRVAGQHREHAQEREQRAQVAEQRARLAQQEAERERAEAALHAERASAVEQGVADEDLRTDDGERAADRGPVERQTPVEDPERTAR